MTSGSNGAEDAIELVQEGNTVILNSTLSDEQLSLIRQDRIDGLYDSKLKIEKPSSLFVKLWASWMCSTF